MVGLPVDFKAEFILTTVEFFFQQASDGCHLEHSQIFSGAGKTPDLVDLSFPRSGCRNLGHVDL